jgi:hypothetical protein
VVEPVTRDPKIKGLNLISDTPEVRIKNIVGENVSCGSTMAKLSNNDLKINGSNPPCGTGGGGQHKGLR